MDVDTNLVLAFSALLVSALVGVATLTISRKTKAIEASNTVVDHDVHADLYNQIANLRVELERARMELVQAIEDLQKEKLRGLRLEDALEECRRHVRALHRPS